MPAVGSDLGNDKRVSVSVCVVRASHTAGMLGLSVDVCLHSVLIFFSPYQSSDRLTCPRTYTHLSPFLDNHRPSSTLKEDKSSDMPSSSHPLWFYVVIKTSYELWHRSLLWGHNQAVLSSLYLYLSSFSRVLETRLIPPGTLTFNPLTAIFTQHYSACIIGLFTNCIVLLNKHWLLYNSFTSLLFTLPLTLSSVLHRPLVYQKIYLSLPYLSCCFFL